MTDEHVREPLDYVQQDHNDEVGDMQLVVVVCAFVTGTLTGAILHWVLF